MNFVLICLVRVHWRITHWWTRRQRSCLSYETQWVLKSRRKPMAKAMSVFTKREGTSSITQSAWLRRSVFYLLLLILWQVIALAGIWPDYLFPGPLAVLGALVNGFQNGQFLQASLLSLQRLGIGYVISLVIGL